MENQDGFWLQIELKQCVVKRVTGALLRLAASTYGEQLNITTSNPLSYTYIDLTRFIHRTTCKIVHSSNKIFLRDCRGLIRFVPFSHEFGYPFPRVITMLDWNTMLLLFRSCDSGVYSQMIILTSCDNHISSLVEECWVHRERMGICMKTLMTCWFFHFLVGMGLIWRRQFTDIKKVNRSSKRSSQHQMIVNINLLMSLFTWSYCIDLLVMCLESDFENRLTRFLCLFNQ